MLELSPARKNKVNLADYNSGQDIENRILMSDFTAFEHGLLEEILFSPLKISIKKLARSLDCQEGDLIPTLEKLTKAGLITCNEDSIVVDKEMRKYFEFQIMRFSSDFKPDMEFLQGLLRKVPIHVLPTWYSIPRTSNNIFESIVEKYLLTPQIFTRYLSELNLGDNRINGIIQDVFSSPQLRISSSDLIAKYNLERRDFEEILIFLEFNFICCLSYEKEDEYWIESVTPFYEWRQYHLFLKETEAAPIEETAVIQKRRESDFAFIEDMTAILTAAKKKSIPFSPKTGHREVSTLLHLSAEDPGTYATQLVDKLCLIKLADLIDGRLYALETANDWLDLSLENKALYLYRHPLNQMASERNLREAEKSVKRVLHGKWVYFDEFIKGVFVPLDEDSLIMLKRIGKTWRYTLPTYDDEKKALIKMAIFEGLFEAGMVTTGTVEGRDCFALTPFGRFFFES